MNIREITETYGITKIQIQYYRIASLLPDSVKNEKRHNFDENEVEMLKEITLLRKIGTGIEVITDYYQGKTTLKEIISDARAKEEIQGLDGAKRLCDMIENYGLQSTRVWESAQTDSGFFPLTSAYEESFDSYASLLKYIIKTVFRTDIRTPKIYIIILLILCIVSGISKAVFGASFLEGFFYPILICAVICLIITPIYFINKFSPTLASFVSIALLTVAVVLLALIILSVPVLILNSHFHFLF